MNPSQSCLNLIKSFEGLRTESYQDGGGVWTLGYGHTSGIDPNETCTIDQANDWLLEDVQKACDFILNNVDCALTQNELDALTSFVFNVGVGNFIHSTLRMALQKGDYQGAADQFLRWNHISGKVSDGLSRRREAERALFLSPSIASSLVS